MTGINIPAVLGIPVISYDYNPYGGLYQPDYIYPLYNIRAHNLEALGYGIWKDIWVISAPLIPAILVPSHTVPYILGYDVAKYNGEARGEAGVKQVSDQQGW